MKRNMTTYCTIRTHQTTPTKDTESLLEEACCDAVNFLQKTWGLNTPTCHVYVTTRWQTLYVEQPPLLWRTLYKLGLSLFKNRHHRLETLWQRSAGWFERYGNLHLIAIKPLQHFQSVNLETSPLYTPMTAKQKFINTLLHELTHAFTAHLKLPLWLNEGFALFAAEKALGYGGLREGTLELLQTPRKKISYLNLPNIAGEDFFYHYAKGYWLTRYLEAFGGLEFFLQERKSYKSIDQYIKKVFNEQPTDKILHSHFTKNNFQQGGFSPLPTVH
ncbi:MAG: hypothetical protein ACRCYY_17215 [Trueperaceae bacterium]